MILLNEKEKALLKLLSKPGEVYRDPNDGEMVFFPAGSDRYRECTLYAYGNGDYSSWATTESYTYSELSDSRWQLIHTIPLDRPPAVGDRVRASITGLVTHVESNGNFRVTPDGNGYTWWVKSDIHEVEILDSVADPLKATPGSRWLNGEGTEYIRTENPLPSGVHWAIDSLDGRTKIVKGDRSPWTTLFVSLKNGSLITTQSSYSFSDLVPKPEG